MDHVHMNSELCTVWWKDVCEPYGTERVGYIVACTE